MDKKGVNSCTYAEPTSGPITDWTDLRTVIGYQAMDCKCRPNDCGTGRGSPLAKSLGRHARIFPQPVQLPRLGTRA